MRETSSQDDLLDQALALVEAAQTCPSEHNTGALERWAQRSEEHARAIAAAERFRATLTRIPRDDPSVERDIRLSIGLWLARSDGMVTVFAGTLAAIALLATVVFLSGTLTHSSGEWTDSRQQLVADQVQLIRTGHGQQKRVTLSDGSTVWVNWSSAIQVTMTPSERRVALDKGAAAFAVTSNPDRPFVVQSGSVETRVTGTEFVVKRRSGQVDVGVIEGSVDVLSGDGGKVSLSANEIVRVDRDAIGPVVHQNPGELGAWRDGIIVFRDRALLDALRSLEPYTSYQLDTTGLWSSGSTVSGTFFIDRADDGLTSILEAQRIDARLEQPNRLVLTQRPPSRP